MTHNCESSLIQLRSGCETHPFVFVFYSALKDRVSFPRLCSEFFDEIVVASKSEEADVLRKELIGLEQQQKLQLENIQAIDAVKYSTRRNQLLQSLEQGVSKQIALVRAQLLAISDMRAKSGETMVMMWLRLLAIAWNIVL